MTYPGAIRPTQRVRPTIWARRRQLLFGLIIMSLLFGVAAVGLVWLPYDPNETNVRARFANPGTDHWLGTDHFGRDLFSRIAVGARTTIVVGTITVSVGLSVGVVLGALSALTGGWPDEIAMRLVDAISAFPGAARNLICNDHAARHCQRHARDRHRDSADVRPTHPSPFYDPEGSGVRQGRRLGRCRPCPDHRAPSMAEHGADCSRPSDHRLYPGDFSRSRSKLPRARHPTTPCQLGPNVAGSARLSHFFPLPGPLSRPRHRHHRSRAEHGR